MKSIDRLFQETDDRMGSEEIVTLVIELIGVLPESQQGAIWRRYRLRWGVEEWDRRLLAAEGARRCRGLARVRRWLMDLGFGDL